MLATGLSLLLPVLTTGVLAVLVARALRDDAVVESLRIEVRRIGEAHEAVCRSRGVHPAATPPAESRQRRRG